MARSKAYLFAGVEIRWRCDPALLANDDPVPAEAVLHYPGGLSDYLNDATADTALLVSTPFADLVELDSQKFEWAITWLGGGEDGFFHSYCNTVPTPSGGTHEAGFRQAITRALRSFGDLAGNRKAAEITADDVFAGTAVMLSVFLRDPQFQGQTKDRLVSADATRQTEQASRDRFEQWLAADAARANFLLDAAIERAEERKRRKKEREVTRKSATRRLRLPGKLADCTASDTDLTELFLVEGDSAGGSAKQARAREYPAIRPLRGKILNTWEVDAVEILASQEVNNISVALGIEPGSTDLSQLRYHRVCILADADSDGLHIATLICALFLRHFRPLVRAGHVFVAMPPLYRIDVGKEVHYALDDSEKNGILERLEAENKRIKPAVQRFKGLGEMNPPQLRETTMDPDTRRLVQLVLDEDGDTDSTFDLLLAKKRAGDRKTWLEAKGDLADVAS